MFCLPIVTTKHSKPNSLITLAILTHWFWAATGFANTPGTRGTRVEQNAPLEFGWGVLSKGLRVWPVSFTSSSSSSVEQLHRGAATLHVTLAHTRRFVDRARALKPSFPAPATTYIVGPFSLTGQTNPVRPERSVPGGGERKGFGHTAPHTTAAETKKKGAPALETPLIRTLTVVRNGVSLVGAARCERFSYGEGVKHFHFHVPSGCVCVCVVQTDTHTQRRVEGIMVRLFCARARSFQTALSREL